MTVAQFQGDVVLWGQVPEEVETRLVEGPPGLRPQDWKSGYRILPIEVIAPFGGTEEMVKDFKANLYPNDPVNFDALTVQRHVRLRAEVRRGNSPSSSPPSVCLRACRLFNACIRPTPLLGAQS